MAKKFPLRSKGFNPFGCLIRLNFTRAEDGFTQAVLPVQDSLFNPYGVLHGAVTFAMVDG